MSKNKGVQYKRLVQLCVGVSNITRLGLVFQDTTKGPTGVYSTFLSLTYTDSLPHLGYVYTVSDMFKSVWDRIHFGTDPLCLHGTGSKLGVRFHIGSSSKVDSFGTR